MLGIGNGASTALCHGLARAGNGLCLMTTQSEELAGKCARLLRASRVPPSGNLRNVRIDWGYTGPDSLLPAISKGKAKEQSIKPRVPLAAEKMFDEELDPLASGGDVGFPVDLSATTAVQQAPSVVPDFYPGNRFIVSAILPKTTRVPGSVILRGEAPDGTPMEFVFPVHVARFQKPWPPLVHTLAAHRIIQELDDGYVQCLGISTDVGPQHCKDIARSAIVRYSTEYQLASKYASFVAVEKDGTEATASSDDSDLELLSDADVDSEEWVSEFEKWDEPDCGEVNEGGSFSSRCPASVHPCLQLHPRVPICRLAQASRGPHMKLSSRRRPRNWYRAAWAQCTSCHKEGEASVHRVITKGAVLVLDVRGRQGACAVEGGVRAAGGGVHAADGGVHTADEGVDAAEGEVLASDMHRR